MHISARRGADQGAAPAVELNRRTRRKRPPGRRFNDEDPARAGGKGVSPAVTVAHEYGLVAAFQQFDRGLASSVDHARDVECQDSGGKWNVLGDFHLVCYVVQEFLRDAENRLSVGLLAPKRQGQECEGAQHHDEGLPKLSRRWSIS